MIEYSKILNVLSELSVDAIMVSDGYNMRYISDFTGATGYLLLLRDKKYLLTDFRYTFQAMEQTKESGFEIIEIGEKGYFELINELLHDNKCRTVAFENEHLLFNDYLRMTKELKEVKFVHVDDKLKKLRIIKNSSEIERLKKAEAIGDIAFSNILNIIKPGVTELEIAAELEYIMKKNGAEGISFETIVASGVNSSMPHACVSSKKIEKGDFVTMDFGCIFDGYCSDMTRTIVVGKASEEQRKIYDTVLKAQLAVLDVVKGGMKGSEVDKIARDMIEDEGYKNCFGHGLGHSVGLEIHENPRFSPSENSIILPGTIETVEPGIYIKDFGGVRIEDMIMLTEDGYQNFTNSEKRLIEL